MTITLTVESETKSRFKVPEESPFRSFSSDVWYTETKIGKCKSA